MTDRRPRWLLPLAIATTVAAAPACTHSSSASVMQSSSDPNYVQVIPNEADRRVDIVVGGKPFTTYMWPTTIKKPLL
jgi:guanyl-specific ribonuclease Sa